MSKNLEDLKKYNLIFRLNLIFIFKYKKNNKMTDLEINCKDCGMILHYPKGGDRRDFGIYQCEICMKSVCILCLSDFDGSYEIKCNQCTPDIIPISYYM